MSNPEQDIVTAARQLVAHWRESNTYDENPGGAPLALDAAVSRLEQLEAERCDKCGARPLEPGGFVYHFFHPKADQLEASSG